MHRLVRIEGLHNFKQYAPLTFVLYNGSKYITLEGEITNSNYILFRNHQDDVSTLFVGFGITDNAKIAYCKKQDPNCVDGIFPMHSSLAALKKTLLSFFDLNTDIKIPSMYKVGDKVQIKSEYDLGSSAYDYPCSFTDMMLEMGSEEKTYIISSIHDLAKTATHYSQKHYKEPYFYKIQTDSHDWSVAMFKGEIKFKVQIEQITGGPKYFYVKFTNGCIKRLWVQSYGFISGHNEVFKLCGHRVDDLATFLNEELDCVRNEPGYEPYINKKENIWIFIDDLKYRFGTKECKKTINPKFYKHLKKKPQQGIVEQIEYSQTKTQENAYQFCKAKGTVCRGNVPEGRIVSGKHSKATVSSRPLAYGTAVGW